MDLLPSAHRTLPAEAQRPNCRSTTRESTGTLTSRPARHVLAAWLWLAASFPSAVLAQAPPLDLDQNAFLYDTNYNPFPYNSNYNASGTFLVPPGINWQSLRGVPLSPVEGVPRGSDGRGPVSNTPAFGLNGPPTPNQFAGFAAFGGLAGGAVAEVTNLNSTVDFYANVVALAWPHQARLSGAVSAVLRAAQVGGAATAGWLRLPGSLIAWGNDRDGQIDVPPALAGVAALAAGDLHTLVVQTNGVVVGWGANDYGQIDIPTGLTNVTEVAAGGNHSLALTGGQIVAWGDDGFGQSDVPGGVTNAIRIAAGFNHSLAVTADGRAVAWGANTFGQTDVPAGLTNVIAVAGGEAHSLALCRNGAVVAWGAGTNSTGESSQFGQAMVPAGLSNVVAITAGYEHSLALRADGTVVAWGSNTYGQTNVPPA